MNSTQELITDGFTVGHAVQTLEALFNNANETYVREAKKPNPDYVLMRKLSKVVGSLMTSIQCVKASEMIIDRIDKSS